MDELKAMMVLNNLSDTFGEIYLVGGAVRDIILKLSISDLDFATPLRPEEIRSICIDQNIKFNDSSMNFGKIIVYIDGIECEITTFRVETYSYTRFPKIEFVNDIFLDQSRRDFTINSIAMSRQRQLLDPFNAITDLENKVVKFIGNPSERIKEDPSRIIRAVRYKVKLNFDYSNDTYIALQKQINEILYLSFPKLSNELAKLSDYNLEDVFNELEKFNLNRVLFDINFIADEKVHEIIDDKTLNINKFWAIIAYLKTIDDKSKYIYQAKMLKKIFELDDKIYNYLVSKL